MRVFLIEQHARIGLTSQVSPEDFSEVCLYHQKNGYADKEFAYSETCDQLGLSPELIPSLLNDYRSNYGKKAFSFPGSVETIAKLSLYYPLGLVSNGTTRGQMGKLQQVGLLPYFDSIIISESFGAKKPDPSLFLACLQELGVDPRDAVFIGDHPEADIAPALSLGMKAVWIKNNNFVPPLHCHARIDSVAELPGLLSSIAS